MEFALARGAAVWRGLERGIDTSIAVHHNDNDPELIVRQFKNMGVDDLAPFDLFVETYEFKGSFLLLAIDLPSEAATGLTKNHIFEVEGKLSLDHPMPVFMRLNVKHGSNVEELLQEIPLDANRLYLEFDLGYCDLHEARVENVWLDLIFDDPSMNRAKISGLVFYRRPRAKF